MMAKRHLITAILGIFCLTTLLFMTVPTRSQTEPEYDAWRDVNDDGKIDILDITLLSTIYGASGNLPKNLNVTNWPEWFVSGCCSNCALPGSNDTLRISVLDNLQRQESGGYAQGVHILTSEPLDLPFAFKPLRSHFNITDMWITFAATVWGNGDRTFRFKVALNEGTAFWPERNCRTVGLNMFTFHVEDQAIRNTMVEGVNVLTFQQPELYNGAWIPIEDGFSVVDIQIILRLQYTQ